VRIFRHSDDAVAYKKCLDEGELFWTNNCMYLSDESRWDFRKCLNRFKSHEDVIRFKPTTPEEKEVFKETRGIIEKTIKALFIGVQLPNLHEEFKLLPSILQGSSDNSET
jgi:hypothetical protein